MHKQRKASVSWIGDAIGIGVLLVTLAVVGISGREQVMELDTHRVLPQAFGLGSDNQQLNANSNTDPTGITHGESTADLRSNSRGRQSIAASDNQEI